ncbi:putative transcription factor Homobox-WOX family [Rosa chinensis]|uniref:Putative transcription factor Homobox-WOX family n=1 Tax=Rosa chinensis TaxID=74649 RepID=A0A2P6RSL4_ROSCH|nr:putative transcription factor Homobox-WOX family [Rosa chinensis]PRQ49460.1 putative transcription factor Homobox-WOX family [Rosa chinensis]PRQ53704.1 putative transcription factor Homobox-WOX family [Rosa chinensis]
MELQAQQPTEEGGSIQAAGSSNRWAPTPPQLRILKGLYYDKGFKYPTPEQIQEICLHLKQYGQIEDKNVFFWFQNLKARERQKLKEFRNVRVGGSLDLNFGSTSSTDDGRSIDLNFGSTGSTSTDRSIDLNFGLRVGSGVDGSIMEQRGEYHQEIETLPLFPMHGEDIFGNMKTTSEGGSGYGGGSHLSLELSLNSYRDADMA